MKPFTIDFKVDAKVLAILFICWKYKFPISYFMAFYEMFGAQTLFILKAMSCTKRITLNDNTFANILEESKELHKQIIKGISTNLKIKQLSAQVRAGKLIDEDIPEEPVIDFSVFTDDYKTFAKNYLAKNVDNMFSESLTLHLDTKELYQNIK